MVASPIALSTSIVLDISRGLNLTPGRVSYLPDQTQI
jgi:hypothetical protein